MELLLLGTAAAEAWPCAWCDCAACAEARRQGGPNIRTRSGALIDNVVKVDFGPDTFMQMQQVGRTFTNVTTLVFTHEHDDHFTPSELQYRGPHFVTRAPLPIMNVFANASVINTLHDAYGSELEALHMELHPPLEPFRSVTAPDGTEILPLPAAHSPGALLLRLTRQGRHIFYGHDSGLFPEETIQALAGVPLDLVLFDCTYGPTPNDYAGHLGIPGVLEMAQKLRSVGAVTPDTLLVATHFSHNSGRLHEDLIADFAPHGVRVAHDGMMIEMD